MANIIREAKSSNDWTRVDLRAYNIQVVEQSLVEFFHLNQLPSVPPAAHHFCETTDRRLAPNNNTYKLLHHLDLAQYPIIGQEASVDNFVARLLETLGYASGHQVIVTHQILPLIICGMECSAQIDVCIRGDKNDYLLLVQENSWVQDASDPEPPLIADAIAAYQQNNLNRDSEITFPGITLVGTSPTFYKIKVTSELNDAVMCGTTPTNAVVVYRHTP